MESYLELDGKVALVTGASQGLGEAIALTLAEKGAAVIVNYPWAEVESDAEQVVSKIRKLGRPAAALQADVSQAREVKQLFRTGIAQFGRLDILVNNAGTSQAKDIFEIEEEDWDFILNTNLKSAFLCSKEAMLIMRSQLNGRIVNIGSVAGQKGAVNGHAHYSASKSGLTGLTKTLALSGAPLGINVNAVAPGIIETTLLYRTHGLAGVARLAESVPLGLGQARDVGLAVAFLCGEGGRYITGTTLDVNGGMLMR